MSIPQSSDAVPEENAFGMTKDAEEGHAHETASPSDEAQGNNDPADGVQGAFDEISGDEFLKEMLATEEAADLFQGAAAEGLPDDQGADDETAELKAKLAEAEAQLAETREQLLRKAADFDNFRKRMNHEKQKAIEFANESLLLDIIPIIDDFERAIQSAEMSPELAEVPAGKGMLDGITMIEKRLTGQLEAKWGLRRFSSVGEPFDPNFHEAMLMEKSPDVEEPTVMEDFARGYTLKDRVIRAAKVKVFM
ncbi:MAG: nucleotide exchange factor GrpE, partial [Treponema sp.]|nr:nucleotide exchange factor GrpE [Treponema sp.]